MRHSSPDQLSETQQKILKFINSFTMNYGYAPSIREICRNTDITSTSNVEYHLRKLQDWGHLNRMPRISRSIRTQNSGQVATMRLPILGRIQAGFHVPTPGSDFAYYDPESYLDICCSQLPKNMDDLYVLEVEGDSMIDAMVNNGDLVVLHKVSQVTNGTMVAVWLKAEEETTLKYYYLENGQVRLQPANQSFQSMFYPPENVEIQGELVHVSRSIKRLM